MYSPLFRLLIILILHFVSYIHLIVMVSEQPLVDRINQVVLYCTMHAALPYFKSASLGECQ